MTTVMWKNNQVHQITPTVKPKKITGTRFGAVLGVNPWATPFQAWCEITKVFSKPFTDSIYTVAGKTIEPKQAEYLKKAYLMENLITPTDKYGKDYFTKTWGDFFPENPIFGGMWDYLELDEKGNVKTVIEMKTTKRAEDWYGKMPEYYRLQVALYAYLLGVDNIMMVTTFLEDKDYENPEVFEVNARNTIIRPMSLKAEYPNIEQLVKVATDWWNKHVVTGISPEYDETKDAEYIKALRTNYIDGNSDIKELISEAELLKEEIDKMKEPITLLEDRLDDINKIIKSYAVNQFRTGDKKVCLKGGKYIWNVSKSEISTINKEALREDGVLDYYTMQKEQVRLTISKNKGDE